MTRKDYEMLSKSINIEITMWRSNVGPVFGTEAVKALNELAQRLSDNLTKDNPRFDRDRFLKACGVTQI